MKATTNNAYTSYTQTIVQTLLVCIFLYVTMINQPPKNGNTMIITNNTVV